MTLIRRWTARPLAMLLALVLAILAIPGASAQSPEPSPVTPLASVGAVQFGGALGPDESRDPEGEAVIRLGTSITGLVLDGARDAFDPTETAAFRLELPRPLVATALRVNLVTRGADGVETIIGAGDWLMDPSWDTLTGTLPAPPPGEHLLRVFRAGVLQAETPIATYDVPRVTGVVTDPLGVLADSGDQIAAAEGRFADGTDGLLWIVVLESTQGAPITDYADDLWAVNADQMWPGDALALIATAESDVAIRVGDDLGFTIRAEEITPVEDGARPAVAEGRYADAIDLVADGLVVAHEEPPPEPGATPTPAPSPTPITVETPDFVGLSRSEAQALARESDLRLRVRFELTDVAPRGTVIAQSPSPGRPIVPNGIVVITVASQPAQVPVPDVRGLDEADAIAALLDAGLEPGARTTRSSASVEVGRVIRTSPQAGVVVQVETTVDYVLSTGPDDPGPSPSPSPTPGPTAAVVTVPDVRGLDEADALTEIGSVGLRAGDRTSSFSDSVDEGAVIRTDPGAGVQVQRGTAVDYTVSRGPEPTATPRPSPTPGLVTVPNVRGSSEDEALDELVDAGLEIGDRDERNHDTVAEGDVIRTEPAAGEQVREGTEVDYFVSIGPVPPPTPGPTPGLVTVPNVRDQSEDDALTELTAAGLVIGDRDERNHDTVAEGDVIRTVPEAGEEVREGTEVDYFVSTGPAASPTGTPRPPPTGAPPGTPRPPVDPGDLLERIRAAGRIVVNVDLADNPWSAQSSDGTFRGYEVEVARALGAQLGVDVAFTTFPLEQVVTGNWGGRFDIAMQHLAITDERRTVLDFSQPYAFDPAQVTASTASGFTTFAEFADGQVCAIAGSLVPDWAAGSLSLTEPPLEPVAPPNDLTVQERRSDQGCLNALADAPDELAGWVASLWRVDTEIAEGAPVVPVKNPVFYAPVGVAYDRAGPDSRALQAAIESALSTLRGDGTLTASSEGQFDGLDLSVARDAGAPREPPQGDDPAFTVDDVLLDQFPNSVAGATLRSLAMNGADLDLLLPPTNRDISSVIQQFQTIGADNSLGLAGLGLVSAPVVTADGSAMLTAARYDGISAGDLQADVLPLFTNQYDEPTTRTDFPFAGKTVTRVSDGTYATGDLATWFYRSSGVVWIVTGTSPLVDGILAALP